MQAGIWVRSEGIGKAELLEDKIVELTDEFSKENVAIFREIRKSFEYGGFPTLSITLSNEFLGMDKAVVLRLILRFFDSLFEALYEKESDESNVKIQMGIKGESVIFRLPKDTQKLFDYVKKIKQ